MKLRIETLTLLLTFIVIGLAGCSGCGQKTAPQAPIEPSQKISEAPTNVGEPTQQEVDVGAEQNLQEPKTSPLIYNHQAPGAFDYGQEISLYPFPSPVIPPDLKARADAEVKRKAPAVSRALKRAGDYTDFEYRKALSQVRDMMYVEALGNLAYAQYLFHHRTNKAYSFAKAALEENPDDFETLLTWGFAYLNNPEGYPSHDDEERVAVYRRLYEMNPDHPYVLHELAKSIYPKHPEEALRYAQKAQQLEHRFVWYSLDGLCYFQLGDYEKALASFERAYAVSNEITKQGPADRIKRVKRAMKDPEFQKLMQKLREENKRLMSPTIVFRD